MSRHVKYYQLSHSSNKFSHHLTEQKWPQSQTFYINNTTFTHAYIIKLEKYHNCGQLSNATPTVHGLKNTLHLGQAL